MLSEEEGEIIEEAVDDRLRELEGQVDRLRQENAALQADVTSLTAALHQYQNKNVVSCGVQTESILETPGHDLNSKQDKQSAAAEDIEPSLTQGACTSSKPGDISALPDWGVRVIAKEEVDEGECDDDDDEEEGELKEAPKSITEALTEAAQSAVNRMGYVYDERSGLYYDYSSGYYYDPETQLFYEPNSGTYYSYDPQSGNYSFHSQVDPRILLSYRQEEKRKQQDHLTESKPHSKKRKLRESDAEEVAGEYTEQKSSEKDRPRKEKNIKQVFEAAPSTYNKDISLRNVRTLLLNSATISTNQAESCGSTSRAEGNIKENIVDIPQVPNRSNDSLKKNEDIVNASKSTEAINSRVDAAEEDCLRGASGEATTDVAQSTETTGSCDESSVEEGALSTEEEGELSDASVGEDDPDSPSNELSGPESDSTVDGSAEMWPPCIRVMVLESDSMSSGTLSIVTCTGATIGREEQLGHVLTLPDSQVSKMHCSFSFNEMLQSYTIKDHASQNGTFLNEQRLSEPKHMSEEFVVQHRDQVRLGGTTLELHIHQSNVTCAECEPGLVQQRSENTDVEIVDKLKKEDQRKEELKRIRKKYGLQGAPQVPKVPRGMSDKAAVRRQTVGSDNPYSDRMDTGPASVHVPLADENKGHKLLSKMGWKEGQGLGKGSSGRTQPITVKLRGNAAAGLGSAAALEQSIDATSTTSRSSDKWRRAQLRYQQLKPTPTAFTHNTDDEDDDDSSSGQAGDGKSKQTGSKAIPNHEQKYPSRQWIAGGKH